MYEICIGIDDARKKVYKELNNQPISPHTWEGKETKVGDSTIDFDLCLTTSSEESLNKGGGLIKVVEFRMNRSESKSSESVNRVSFSVPFFPQATYRKK